MKRLFLVFAVAFAVPAHAGVTLSQFPPNPGVLPGGGWRFTPGTTFADPPPPRAWVNGVYGGVPAAVVTDTLSLRGPAGPLSVAVATSATAPSIASSLARVASRAFLPLTAGMIAYDLLKKQGIRQGASGAEMDQGANEVDTINTEYGYVDFGPSGNIIYDANKSKACSSAVNAWSSYGNGYSARFVRIDGNTCVGERAWPDTCLSVNGCQYLQFTINLYGTRVTQGRQCPQINDALTGELYTPGYYSDGKCITGRYTAATDAQVSARLAPAVAADPGRAAKGAVEAGAPVESSPYTVTGPASQTGTPTTTTATTPTGTTTTTTTPTYSYTYQGDTINITTITTTTINNTTNEGDTTTTTTTTTPGSDDKGMCAMYPDSLACIKPGTPPTDTPPAPKVVPFSIDPVTFGGQGACPPPITFSALGSSYAFPWDPLCNVLVTWVRPVVLVLSVAAAAMVFIGGLKS